MRALRDRLTPVFAAGTVGAAVTVLDPMLRDAAVVARLSSEGDTARWDPAAGLRGMTALRARLLSALAAHLVRHGAVCLGVCQAQPCRCVYVDRSRARTPGTAAISATTAQRPPPTAAARAAEPRPPGTVRGCRVGRSLCDHVVIGTGADGGKLASARGPPITGECEPAGPGFRATVSPRTPPGLPQRDR